VAVPGTGRTNLVIEEAAALCLALGQADFVDQRQDAQPEAMPQPFAFYFKVELTEARRSRRDCFDCSKCLSNSFRALSRRISLVLPELEITWSM